MNFIPLNGWPQLKEIPEQLEHFREVYARFAKVNRWYHSIEETEQTGNPVIFEKALKLNATALSVDLLPIQSGSGDPSPTNVRPISGRTEVNVVDNGFNRCSEFYSASTAQQYAIALYAEIDDLKPDTTYAITLKGAAGAKLYYNENLFTGGNYFTLTGSRQTVIATTKSGDLSINYDDTYGWKLFKNQPNNTIVADVTELCVSLSDEHDGEYVPYTGRSEVTIQLGQTVYGCTLDVKRGVLTITWVLILFDGSDDEAWAMSQSADYAGNAYIRIEDAKNNSLLLANMAKNGESIGTYAYGQAIFQNKSLNAWLFNEATTESDFRDYLSTHNLQICYELATPTTVQLTGEELEMLKGYNLISTDADSLTVKAYTI